MSTPFTKEACVEGLSQELKAQAKGADRIELCADLKHDGLSPDIDVIMEAHEQMSIPIRVMIRPRAGDFVYSKQELQEMVATIEICKSLGIEGVVFGALKANNKLDMKAINFLCEAAGDMKKVFHKAIEDTPDLLSSAQKLFKETPIDAILTAGGKGRAAAHLATLRELVGLAQGQGKELVACGKIDDKNLAAIHESIQAPAYHGRKIVGRL